MFSTEKNFISKAFSQIVVFVGVSIITLFVIAFSSEDTKEESLKNSTVSVNNQLFNKPQAKAHSFTQHTDAEHKYSISYPSSWKKIPSDVVDSIQKQTLSDQMQIVHAIYLPKKNLSMSVIITKANENETLIEAYDRMHATSPLTLNIISQQEVTIQNIKAMKSLSTTTFNKQSMKYVHVVLIREGFLWYIVIGGNPKFFNIQEDAIDMIINSLDFKGA